MLYVLAAVVILAVIFLVDMAPVFIAASRGHPSTAAIFVLCFFLSWTVVGWIAALIWACGDTSTAGTTVIIDQRDQRRSRRSRRRDDYDD